MVFLNCAHGAIKYVLVTFNFVCAIAGVVLMIHGGLALTKVSELRSILSNDYLSDVVPSIVIFIGVFIFLISFLGCCGAIQSNICLLETYSIFLLVLVLSQIVLACFIFLFVDDLQKDAGRSFNRLWRSRINSQNSLLMVNLIQENLECCGSRNLFDYNVERIPGSCCEREIDHCTIENSYKIGCHHHLEESIRSAAQTISYSCIATAVFELIGAILAFVLSGSIRKVHAIRRCCF